MTNRTTQKDLEGLVNLLNRITSHSLTPYVQGKDKGLTAQVGAYLLDGAYGGWKLAQIVNEGGGQRDITLGYQTKADCYRQIAAYIRGIEDCITQSDNLDAKINVIIKG